MVKGGAGIGAGYAPAYASGRLLRLFPLSTLQEAFSSGSVVRLNAVLAMCRLAGWPTRSAYVYRVFGNGRRRRMRRNVIGVILAGFGIVLPASAQTVTVSPSTAYVHQGTFYQFAA